MQSSQSTSALSRFPTRSALSGSPKSWWRTLRIWLARVRTRKSLGDLDDRMLQDIGISRMDAVREARRMPWDGDDAAQWSVIRRLS